MASKINGSDKLSKAGWSHDGLWWKSPYTGHRYAKKEALAVEELRRWASKGSAILEDKNHSMWVLAEERDCQLQSWEELSDSAKQQQEIKQLGIDTCYGKNLS